MAKTETLNYLSHDGETQIHARTWEPDNGEYVAILQIAHGMLEYIERYTPFAEFLTTQGFKVVGNDHLGHGASIQKDEDLGYTGNDRSDNLIEDMHTLRLKMQEADKPYFMMGHSMGSFMFRKYLSVHGTGLSGAIVMGTGFIPEGTLKMAMTVAKVQATFLGWKHRSKLLQQLSYSAPYKKYSLDGSDVTNSWLTKDTLVVEKYYADPKCTYVFTDNAYLGMFEAIMFAQQQENIENIPKDLPMFLVAGQDDPVGDLGVGVKKVYDLYKNAGISDITWKLYENDRHEILNETDKEEVFHDLLSWMKVRIS